MNRSQLQEAPAPPSLTERKTPGVAPGLPSTDSDPLIGELVYLIVLY